MTLMVHSAPPTHVLTDITSLHNCDYRPIRAIQRQDPMDAKDEYELDKSLETALRKGCRCLWGSCTKTFNSWQLLHKHVESAHAKPIASLTKIAGTSTRPAKNYACNWKNCTRPSFHTTAEVMEHVRSHHINVEKYTCPICQFVPHFPQLAIKHLRSHREQDPPAIPVSYLPHAPQLHRLPPLPRTMPKWQYLAPAVRNGKAPEQPDPTPVSEAHDEWDFHEKEMSHNHALIAPSFITLDPLPSRVASAQYRDIRPIEAQGPLPEWNERRIGWEVLKQRILREREEREGEKMKLDEENAVSRQAVGADDELL